jgi:hypothetical protein
MNRATRRVLRVLIQFVVAGGLTEVVDAWVVELSLAWRVAVLVLVQLAVAVTQTLLEDRGTIPPVPRERRLADGPDDAVAGEERRAVDIRVLSHPGRQSQLNGMSLVARHP